MKCLYFELIFCLAIKQVIPIFGIDRFQYYQVFITLFNYWEIKLGFLFVRIRV